MISSDSHRHSCLATNPALPLASLLFVNFWMLVAPPTSGFYKNPLTDEWIGEVFLSKTPGRTFSFSKQPLTFQATAEFLGGIPEG